MKAIFYPYELIFKQASGTSRGILHSKKTYFLQISDGKNRGIGECAFFKGLSHENEQDVEEKLLWICQNIHLSKYEIEQELINFPCIQFGYEQAILNLYNQNKNIFFPSEFTSGKSGIPINGLIWMGSIDFMNQQITEKLNQGFKCLKLKIGVNWIEEHKIIQELRKKFPLDILEIRVDANGAFSFEESKKVLNELYKLKIHSIEQPIKQGNLLEISYLCKNYPIPIALDEELIGVFNHKEKEYLISEINPKYLIFKPSLIGGIKETQNWINLCEKYNKKWWITSALESNIALNFLAQWTYTLKNPMYQGLGTGSLFTNNFKTSLKIISDKLFFIKDSIL